MHTVQLVLFYNVFTYNRNLFVSHSMMSAFLCYFTNSVVCCIIFFNCFHSFSLFYSLLSAALSHDIYHILLRDVTVINPYKMPLFICYLS